MTQLWLLGAFSLRLLHPTLNALTIGSGGNGVVSPITDQSLLIVDHEAGVSFRSPWAEYTTKNGHQIENLIKSHPETEVISGLTLTCGIYPRSPEFAKTYLPYLLVWYRIDQAPPTRVQLRATIFDPGNPMWVLRQFMGQFFSNHTPEVGEIIKSQFINRQKLILKAQLLSRGEVNRQVLVQVMRGRTAFIGLFYRESSDQDILNKVAKTISIESPYRITWNELNGKWVSLWFALGVVLFLGGGVVLLFLRSRT